jgi:hypothetical protein
MFPEDKLIVVVLGNLEDAAVNTMAGGLASIAFGEDVRPPGPRGKVEGFLPSADYGGRYEVRPDFLIDVKQDGQNLFLRGTGGDYLPLEPSGKDAFFYRQFYVTVRFQKSKSGKVDRLLWNGETPCQKVAENAAP